MALLLVVLIGVSATFVLDVPAAWVNQSRELMHLMQVASLMVAVAVGGIAISRWYLTSDAPALWIGVALCVYGLVRLGAAELAPLVLSADQMAEWATWLRPAAQIVVVVLLARAVATRPVSNEFSGPKLAGAAVLGLTLAAVILRFLPTVASFIDGAALAFPRSYGVVNNIGLMPFAYTALAIVLTWQGYRRRRWLFAWLGLFLFSIAIGDVTRVVAPPPVESGLVGKEVLRLLGLLLALNGATREILYTYRDSSTRLARSEYSAMTAHERIREGQAVAEERAHEARSALAAIEGATRTLEHYRDRLPPETQTALSSAISGEIRRLQNLVSVEQEEGKVGAFSLAESLAPLVASERARGVEVDLRVPGDMDVIGRAASTEQVIQTVFDNARRYAPNTRLTVRAEREHGWIVLRIEDRGPGVSTEHREAIFQRGVRGDAHDVPGSGLGLFVAGKLMKEQDGELWVDQRPGGGASFAIALPAADPSDAGQPGEHPVQRVQDAGDVPERGGLSPLGRGD